jgi:hypothetical protein
MLRGCMINGFGWFSEERYRRSWLLFDEIDYIFPRSRTQHPPINVLSRPDFRVIQPEADGVDERVERSKADANDAEFRVGVLQHMSKADLRIAEEMVRADMELRGVDETDPVFCVSYLVDKLLDHADAQGAIPIVGQDYAIDLIRAKLNRRARTELAPSSLVTASQGLNVFAFQAGLSYRFLSDADLLGTDMAQLRKFKEDNRVLLDRHHRHIVQVAQEFEGLPRTPEFVNRLAVLRAEAEATRQALDDTALDAWRTAGLDLAQKLVVATMAGAATALGILAHATIGDVVRTATTAAAAGLGVAGAAAIGTIGAIRRSRRSYLGYLMNAEKYLRVYPSESRSPSR